MTNDDEPHGRVVFFLVLASAAFSVLILSRWIEVAVQ